MIEEDYTKMVTIRVRNQRTGEPWRLHDVPDGIYRLYFHEVFKFLDKCGRVLVKDERDRENPDPNVDVHVRTENDYD